MKTVSIEPFIIRSFKKIRFLYAKCYVGCVWSLRRWIVEAASDGILRIWSRVQGFCQVLFFSKRKTSRRSQYVALLKQFFCFIFFSLQQIFPPFDDDDLLTFYAIKSMYCSLSLSAISISLLDDATEARYVYKRKVFFTWWLRLLYAPHTQRARQTKDLRRDDDDLCCEVGVRALMSAHR